MRTAEEQPLLGTSIGAGECEDSKQSDVILDFEKGDLENPREWPNTFKWAIVLLLACMAFTVTFTCIGIVPLASSIVRDLDHSKTADSSASALLVTIWELGEAAGPLFIAPLSEVVGRYPVMNVCNILFITTTILAALSQSTQSLVALRALTGLTVSSNVLNPAILGDLFESDERGSPMSLIMLAPLIGGAIGPAISGAIAETLGWRQVLFIAAGLAVVCEILFLTCFRETYKVVILRHRVNRWAIEAGGKSSNASSDHRSVGKLWESITRPAQVLYGSGVLLALSFYGSVTFSYFYVMSITLADILKDRYGFSPALTGLAFMSFSAGSFLGVTFCHLTLDRIYIQLGSTCGGKKPEYRLPMAILGGFTLPLAITAYGWITHMHLPAWMLLLSVAILGFTMLISIIPLSAYVVDAFGVYSASAMTGIIVTRCLASTFLPLTVDPLTKSLGYGWGFTFLGAVTMMAALIPVFVLRYGERWRQWSKFTRDE